MVGVAYACGVTLMLPLFLPVTVVAALIMIVIKSMLAIPDDDEREWLQLGTRKLLWKFIIADLLMAFLVALQMCARTELVGWLGYRSTNVIFTVSLAMISGYVIGRNILHTLNLASWIIDGFCLDEED